MKEYFKLRKGQRKLNEWGLLSVLRETDKLCAVKTDDIWLLANKERVLSNINQDLNNKLLSVKINLFYYLMGEQNFYNRKINDQFQH